MQPTTSKLKEYLLIASVKFDQTIDKCRNKYGQYTIEQWKQLLNS